MRASSSSAEPISYVEIRAAKRLAGPSYVTSDSEAVSSRILRSAVGPVP
jgi:hypothetical protein